MAEELEQIQEVDIQGEPSPQPPSKARKLYQALLNDGYTQENLLGGEDNFVKVVTTKEGALKMYNALKAEGYNDDNLMGGEQGFVSTLVEEIPLEKKSQVVTETTSDGLPVGASESTTNIPTVPLDKEGKALPVPQNPIDYSKNIFELEDIGDDASKAQAKKYRDDLKAQGYDADKVYDDFKDIDENIFTQEGATYSKEKLLQEYKENPQKYERDIANLKFTSLHAKSVYDLPAEDREKFQEINIGGDTPEERRANNKDIAFRIRMYGGKNEKELLRNFATIVGEEYGAALESPEKLKEDPRSKYLNEYQIAALQYLEDTNPEVASSYGAMMVDPKLIKKGSLEESGYQEKASSLEQIGLQLYRGNLNTQLQGLINKSKEGQLDQADIDNYNELESKIKDVDNKIGEINVKYPIPADREAKEAAMDLTNNSTSTWYNRAFLSLGRAVDNTFKGVYDFATEPFRNDEESKLYQLATIGEAAGEDVLTYLPRQRTAMKTYNWKISKDIYPDYKNIIDNKSLSADEKTQKVYQLLQNNPDKFTRIPYRESKIDINPTSVYYSVVDLGSSLVPFIGLEMVTGGGATPGVLRKLLSSFTAAAATGFHDNYVAAIREGSPNPYSQALVTTGIMSAAMAGAGTADMVKSMVGTKTTAGSLISKLSNKEIDAVLNKIQNGTLKNKILDFGKSIGKDAVKSIAEGAKGGAKFEAFMAGGKILDNNLKGENINYKDLAKEAALGVLNFTVFGGATGLAKSTWKNITDIQGGTLLKASQNPSEYLGLVQKQLADGSISREDYNQIKDNIELASRVAENIKYVDDSGKELSEKKKAQLLLAKMQEAKLNEEAEGDIPDKLRENLANQAAEVKSDIANIQTAEPEEKELPKPEEAISTPTENQKEIERLRAEEQAELDSKIPNADQYRVDGKVDRDKLTNKEDIKAFDEVYDKYDGKQEISTLEALVPTPKAEVKLEKPTEEQIAEDYKNKNFVTFTYENEADVPEQFKDKISSRGEINGKKIIRVTLPKSVADYELSKITPKAEEVTPAPIEKKKEVELKNMSDSDIENRMTEIQDKGSKSTAEEKNEFDIFEKEMERRERDSVFNVTLDKVNDAIDALIKKEKEMPNGWGSFIEKQDAIETKKVADKYLNPKKITNTELKKDFSNALRGNPTTWYADGLQLRESLKEATNRGIDTKEMVDEAVKVYTKAGYDIDTARGVVAGMLKPIFKGATEAKLELPVIKEKSKEEEVIPMEGEAEQPPFFEGGKTIVTRTGLTEEGRQKLIAKRNKETKVTERSKDEQAILDEINSYNSLKAGRLGKQKPEGLAQLNKIRIKIAEFNEKHGADYEFDSKRGVLLNDNNRSVKRKTTEGKETEIDESGKVLRDRDLKTQEVFDALLEQGAMPTGYRADGLRMSDAQLDATVQDILDGVPSRRANNYLDSLENQIAKDDFDFSKGDSEPSYMRPEVTLDYILGTAKETVTEPMTEESLNNWLETESERTPENEEVYDNIDNLITEYETRNELEGEVQPTPTATEERVTGKIEPTTKEQKVSGEPEPAKPASKTEVKEPKNDAERKSLADRLRSAKIQSDKLFDATIGLPVAVWNGAVELVAKSIEGGMLVADAIKRGINYIEKNHKGKWDKKAYNDKVIEELGYKGININGEDVIAKPIVDKQSAEMINGFYSPLEQGILDTKGDKFTGKEWAKKLEGTTEGDELKFTGMSDFLSENANKSLTKQEVLDYMKNNRIEIVEVVLGGGKKSGEKLYMVLDENGYDAIGQALNEEQAKSEVQENEGWTYEPIDMEQEGVETKYHSYQLPGESSNYKEVLITLPNKKAKIETIYDYYITTKNGEKLSIEFSNEDNIYKLYNEDGYFESENQNPEKLIAQVKSEYKDIDIKKQKISTYSPKQERDISAFQSSHFDEPNILAHIRINTRVDAEGNKVLHIEEFQSDWGQQGKRSGFGRNEKEININNTIVKLSDNGKYYRLYKGERFLSDISKEEGDSMSKYDLHNSLVQEANRLLAAGEKENIPTAPFVTETANWTKLAWKVAVKEAVKEGADKITWTTGEQQNDRYDLSKSVKRIDFIRVGEDKYKYEAIDLNSKRIAYDDNGTTSIKDIENMFGKDVAEKVKLDKKGDLRLEGEGLQVGGTGMKGFYGSPKEGKLGIVGEVAKSLFKQEPKLTKLNLGNIEIENNKYTQDIAYAKKGKNYYKLYFNPTEKEYSAGLFDRESGELIDLVDIGEPKNREQAIAKFTKKFKDAKLADEFVDASTQNSIDITPEIKAAVKEGMPLFKSPYQKIADFLRGGKLDKDIAMAGVPFLKEVWNGALEVAAKTAELTGDSVKAIKEAVKYIKSTDWYKSLSTSDREKAVDRFIDEHIDLLPKGKASLDLAVETEHPYLYRGSTEKRVSGLMRHIMESEDVSAETKEDINKKGIEYAIASNEEARKVASEIVNAFGEEDALKIAEQTDMHASVRSAIFAETIDRAYLREKNASTDAEKIEAAEQWKDRANAYDKLLTAGGQFTAYVNHFYGTSPLGFVMRENEITNQRFNEWYKDKQPTYQELLDALNETAEGKAYLAEEVERIVKEERKQRRATRDKNIDDFFDKAKLQGGTYATVIPPAVWNGAMDVMKAAVKGGDRIADAVQRAIESISSQIGNNWDKEKFRKEYESLLTKVADADKKEGAKQDLASVYERRKRELERRIVNKDFSAEEYKDKKTLSDKEKAAKEEYQKVKELYDEEKKKSPEWQDKKAKQFLEKFRDRMKGLDEKQKEEVVRKSIKKLAETGALREDEFKKIVAETIGFKDLSDAQVKQIEDLTATINRLSDVEDAMVANPNEQTIAAFKKAKEESIQAGLDLYNIVHKKADVIGTIKSWVTGSLLSVPTLIKNVAQNVIMQGFIRFPKSVVKQIGELGIYGITYIGNKTLGTKMYEPTSNIFKAQKGYFKGYAEGLKRGWFNFKRGTQEQDYFGKTSYQSTLAPRQALRDLKMWKSGEKFLTKTEVLDRWLRSNIFARQADFILRGMGFGDRPQRFAAERTKAVEIGSYELKLTDDASMIAFIESPQKMAYKTLVESGVDKADALRRSIEIEDRIKQEGSKAVLEEENLLSKASIYIEKGLQAKKDEGLAMKGVKGVASVGKTLTFPFVKIPANVYWQMFKLFNPEVSIGQSLIQAGEAYKYAKKGDNARARQAMERSKDSMAMAALGIGINIAATTLISQGYIRSNPNSEDKAKVKAGLKLFGKGNQIDIGTLMGGKPYWVDLAWLGPIGAEMDIKQRLNEDKIKAQLKGEKPESKFGEWWNGLEYSGAAALNQLVFDQGARTVDAIRGGQDKTKIWFVNTMNTFENMFTGATYVAISKAMLPEEPRLKGDDVIEELKNNAKQRNVLLRLATSRPPSRISMWGDPIKKDNTLTGVMGNILGFEPDAPVQFGAVIYDDYRKTLDARFFPSVEDNKLTVDGKQVEITQSQKDELETLIGKYRKALVAPFISDCAESTFGVPVTEVDEDGIERVKSKYLKYSEIKEPLVKDWAEQKILALNKLYDEGKKAGMEKFLENHPEYAPKILNKMEERKKAKEEAHVEKFGEQAEKKIRQINKKP